MTYTEKALELRPVIEQASQSLEDAVALTAVELFPKWEDLVENATKVAKGFRFQYDNKLYRTEQPRYTFTKNYVPGATGTESLFEVIDESHAGTIDDPIPYSGNMELFSGTYYEQDGVVYYCTRDTGIPVYSPLSELVGLYVEVVNDSDKSSSGLLTED